MKTQTLIGLQTRLQIIEIKRHPRGFFFYNKEVDVNMKEINVNEIDRVVDSIIIDVREDYELEETGTIKGAIHIPMNEVPNRLNDIPKDREIYILCRSGVRSYNVAKYLNQIGYDAINLDGGIINYKGDLVK